MQRLLFLTVLFFQPFCPVFAQENYPKNDFRSPVDTTLSLAGNFGEIRPNHFHAGFDVRTNNREGMPVYAVADGYVSRIRISPYGYGKALYITHPNGYTSVYGHLREFGNGIGPFLKRAQYAKESFEIDTLLAPDALPVKKGQLIALSGNTGGSQGPHLHFEIRDSNEMPVNPYLFGYAIRDTVKPRITQLAIYPLDEYALVNGRHTDKKIAPVYRKGKYTFLKQDTITVQGKIGFGIECYDTETGSVNRNAVYSVELQSGGKRIFYYEMNKFSFENSRYVNAHIDYPSKQKHGTKIQKCFLAKNNQIGIYKDVVNNGIIDFCDENIHWITYIVKDYNGNTTEIMLKVKGQCRILSGKCFPVNPGQKMDCTKENEFNSPEAKISIPAYALYDDIFFNSYPRIASLKGTYSPLQQVLTDEVPLQKAYTLGLKPVRLPDSLQSKACIISVDDKGRRSYEGGKYENGWVTTKTSEFGTFAVGIDTIAPKLKPAFHYDPNKTTDLSKAKRIGIIARDDLSGIRKYRAIIDGKWVLCEYEFKENLLFYTFDDSLSKGNHTFTIEVSDDKQNKSTFTFIFCR
jgi:murein DD-endopeptidase MepM/ murein hydrolase activator NlpD